MNKIKLLIGAALCAFAVTVNAQNAYQDGINLVSDALNGPWGVGGGITLSTSGTGAKVAFGTITYNLMPNTNGPGFISGPIVGYDYCWSRRAGAEFNSLSGGWSVSGSGNWLNIIGTSYTSNLLFTATGYQLLATPHGGGPVGAITGASISADVFSWKTFHLKPTFIYNNRNGQAGFNGNFIGGALFVTHEF